jgi:hypothetical protein
MPKSKKAPQATSTNNYAQQEYTAQLDSIAAQRNLFGNQLATANGKLAAAYAHIAELEQQLKTATEKKTNE